MSGDEDPPPLIIVGIGMADPKHIIGLAVARHLKLCGGETTMDRIMADVGPNEAELNRDRPNRDPADRKKFIEEMRALVTETATAFMDRAEEMGIVVRLGPKIILTAKGRESLTPKDGGKLA